MPLHNSKEHLRYEPCAVKYIFKRVLAGEFIVQSWAVTDHQGMIGRGVYKTRDDHGLKTGEMGKDFRSRTLIKNLEHRRK